MKSDERSCTFILQGQNLKGREGRRNLNRFKLLHVLFCSTVAVLYRCSERGRQLSHTEDRHCIPPPRPLTTCNYIKHTARGNQFLVNMVMTTGLTAWPEQSQHTELPHPADSFTLLRAFLPTFVGITSVSNSPCSGSSQHHRLCGQQKSLLTHARRSASASGIITKGSCFSIGNWRGGVFPEGAEAVPLSP